MLIKIIVGMGILLLLAGLFFGVVWFLEDNASAEIVQAIPATETPKSTILYFDLPTPTVSSVEATMEIEPTPIPTKVPLVSGYVLEQTIDLSSNAPVAMTLHLSDGTLMSTNWAGAIGYKDTDDQSTIFDPSKGVIYSYLGDVLTTWAHSGTIDKKPKFIGDDNKQYFFATNWDLYIRKSPENITLSSLEAHKKAETLKGIIAYLCQAEPNSVEFLSDHDANSKCPGKEIELELVAIVIVEHDKIPEYDNAGMGLGSWLVSNYPGAGFENLNRDNGWLVRFCIDKFSDQESDGSPWYLYNAGVIGFRIKDGE